MRQNIFAFLIGMLWVLAAALTACIPAASTPPSSDETVTPAAIVRSPAPSLPLLSASSSAATAQDWDKCSLWTATTQLRGANIWQRIRVPALDGEELLGNGYIGPPYTQQDFDRLAALGANYVNLSIPGIFSERPPYSLDEQAQAHLSHLLEMAARANLFAVISFRSGPGRSDFTFYRDGAGVWYDPSLLIETLWSDPEAQNAWVEMWRYTAEQYRHLPHVAGYDLMVEPNANEVLFNLYNPSQFYPHYANTLYDWNVFYPRMVEAIRNVDSRTPILVGNLGSSSVAWLPYLQPISAYCLVYAVHQYAPFVYTHQSPEDGFSYPGSFDLDWDGQLERFDHQHLMNELTPLLQFQQAHHARLAVNEFGVVRWAPNAAQFLSDQMDFFEQQGFNYALWVWEARWQPWYTWGDKAMYYPFGSDPNNLQEVENELFAVILNFWKRNILRPKATQMH